MGKTIHEVMRTLPKERQEKIEALAKKLIAEEAERKKKPAEKLLIDEVVITYSTGQKLHLIPKHDTEVATSLKITDQNNNNVMKDPLLRDLRTAIKESKMQATVGDISATLLLKQLRHFWLSLK